MRFFDTDVTNYIHGSSKTSEAVRKHDINDNAFSCGFYPSPEQYAFPQGDIIVGTTSGASVNISGNNITITGANVTINASEVTLGAQTTIDGKVFLEHTHSNGNEGNPTGAVI